MATIVQLSGPPGTGKTWGVKYLDPAKTFCISTDKKGLSWAGWRKDYNKEKKNYLETSDLPTIYKVLKAISDNRPEIKYITIDTLNSITSDMVMLEMKKASFDKAICRIKTSLIAGNSLEIILLQSSYEI